MTRGKGSAWHHIVIAGLTGNLVTGNLRCPIGVGHDNETVGHDVERGEKKDSPKGGLSGNGYCLM